MSTKLACLQDFAKRDAGVIRTRFREVQTPTSRDWVRTFSILFYEKLLLAKPWSGKINQNMQPAQARIDFGRWIAACPFCGRDCMVDPDDPFFFCLHCAGNGSGDAAPCIFPDDRDAIEIAVLERPVMQIGKYPSKTDEALNSQPILPGLARNWAPGEKSKDLREQHTEVLRALQREIK